MTVYEYKAVPAPRKGEKAKGVKTSEGRLALALQTALNVQSSEGWEFVRAETLPLEERAGLTSKTVNYHTVLVFRREAVEADPLEEALAGAEPDFGAFPEEIKDENDPDPDPSDRDPVEALGYGDDTRTDFAQSDTERKDT